MISLARLMIYDVVTSSLCGQQCWKPGPLYMLIDGKFFGWVVDSKGQPK